VALEHWKVDSVIGAAHQKGTQPELNCDWDGGPEISMREKRPNWVGSVGLGVKAEERMAVGKKRQIKLIANMNILIRGICLITRYAKAVLESGTEGVH
jgi:hypothetical protein